MRRKIKVATDLFAYRRSNSRQKVWNFSPEPRN
jgi:hypothetical protein